METLKRKYMKPTVQIVELHSQCQILVGNVQNAYTNLGTDDDFILDKTSIDEVAR